MIILVTNRQDHTADFLILELQRRQIDYVRFNAEDFPQRVQVTWRIDSSGLYGYFSFPKVCVPFDEIRSVCYRRPVPPVPFPGIDDPVALEFVQAESQASLDGVWRCLNCFWVSHPDHLRASLKSCHAAVATYRSLGYTSWMKKPGGADAYGRATQKEVVSQRSDRRRVAENRTLRARIQARR